MRQVVLDTETTGLDPLLGHRVIEIGAVELVNRRATTKVFHRYLNPERDSDEAALRVHGLTAEFLRDKAKFREVVDDFLSFIDGAALVIHNAGFDLAFINHELSLLDLKPVTTYCAGIVDTLKLAREMHPGKRNALDSLCERYQIDKSARTLHGALLDAQLLADVYLAMTRGQESLMIEEETLQITIAATNFQNITLSAVVLTASAQELEAHEQQLGDIVKASSNSCIWRKLAESGAGMAARPRALAP
jgi:DNA polymerase III subunit epsilon